MATQKIPLYIPVFINSATYTPARVLPRLYFYNGQVDCESWYIADGNNASRIQTAFPYFDHYNVSGSQFPTTTSRSLLFNNEAAVYGQVPDESLYTTYWEKYIEFLYNPKTRVLNCSAIIPLADYFHMELNDIVNFRGNYWHLRAINDYSLKTGECNLQLVGPVIPDVFDTSIPIPPAPPTPVQASSSVSWSYAEVSQDGEFKVFDNSITLATLTANGSGNTQVSQSHYVTASLVPVSYPGNGVTMSLNVNGGTTLAVTGNTNTTISASFLVGAGQTYKITGSIIYNGPPPPQASSSVSWSYSESAQDGTFTVYDNASTIATLTANGNGNSQISQSHYVTASLVPAGYPSSGSVTMSLNVNGGTTISTTAYTNTTITASFLVASGSAYGITGSIQWNPPGPFTVEYLVVAGGGGGGQSTPGQPTMRGGGGGAGGFKTGSATLTNPTSLSVVVGAGGTINNNGNTSSFNSLVSTAGGKGGTGFGGNGSSGGSGGGGASYYGAAGSGTAGEGNNGSAGYYFNASNYYGGAGGGAGSAASAATAGSTKAWLDGNSYAGGGAGDRGDGDSATSGSGGNADLSGKNGIVIVRYSGSGSQATGGIISYNSGYTYHTFISNGTFTY